MPHPTKEYKYAHPLTGKAMEIAKQREAARKLTPAISAGALIRRKFKTMALTDKWLASFGAQERTGSWIIWGESGNGKTSLALQLAHQLAHFGAVVYNSLEEGASLSMCNALKRHRLHDVSRKFHLLDREPYAQLMHRLSRKKSPDIIIIDSIQYLNINREQYKAMVNTHRKKLFILVSHADGRLPEGATAKAIRYDANVKIRVEGHKAFPAGRDVGGQEFIIWQEQADLYHLEP